MRNIIVDIASMGQDALAKALESKELNVLGVTVSPDVENYDDLCNLNINAVKQVKDVPVFKGAQRPLLLKDYIAGKTCPATATEHKFEEKHAVNFLIDSAEAVEDLEILCLGTLSNVALAILKNEEAMKKVKRIYIAGGALLGWQTTTPTSQHNILADVEAAETVFRSGIDLTLIPAHITENLPMTALSVVLGAECETWDAFLTMDTGIGFTRGQTIIDLAGQNPINGFRATGKRHTVVTAVK